jgi:hypothetical protein
MQKIKIIVRLPHNRNYAGRLHVENSAGKRLIGPFPVGGRANDPMAYDSRNSRRDPALPFGDTPCGGYQVKKIISTGAGTAYSSEEFGSAGIILLQPVSGDAALADANGSFGFFIQGGAFSRTGHLRPTDGSLRLANRDQRKLVSLLQSFKQIDCECLVSDGELARKGRKIVDVPVASVLAQGKKILAGMVGAGTLEPAHRAFLKKMLLAGRITMSIPSLLMMSTPPFSQHASGSQETRILLAQRHTLSFPIMLAQVADTGGSSTDYSGHLPSTSDANQNANSVLDNSTQAAHDQSDEAAKHDSGQGFDTSGSTGGSGMSSVNSQTSPDNSEESQNNDDDGNNSPTGANQTSDDNSFVTPYITPSRSGTVPRLPLQQAPVQNYATPVYYSVNNSSVDSAVRRLNKIQVPPPIPPQAAIIGFGQEMDDPESELVFKGVNYGMAVAKAVGELAGKRIPDVTIILIAGRTIIDAENGADVYLVKQNEVYDQALAYLKDPGTRDNFARLITAVRYHRQISENTPVAMLRAAEAIAAAPDNDTKRVVWNALMSPDARQAALNRLMIESRDFIYGKAVEKTFETAFSAQLSDLNTRRHDFNEAAEFLKKANVALTKVNDQAARDSLNQGIALANQIMARAYATEAGRTVGAEYLKDVFKDTVFGGTETKPQQ